MWVSPEDVPAQNTAFLSRSAGEVGLTSLFNFFFEYRRACLGELILVVVRQDIVSRERVSCSKLVSLKISLLAAVKKNDLDRVRLLVEQGADKDKCDINGSWTPLIWSCRKGFFAVTQYLVEQGASLDKANSVRETPLIHSIIGGHLDVARYLLEQGADRDKADIDDYTPLLCAAQYGHLEITKMLMSYGADLNARNYADELPIDIARTD